MVLDFFWIVGFRYAVVSCVLPSLGLLVDVAVVVWVFAGIGVVVCVVKFSVDVAAGELGVFPDSVGNIGDIKSNRLDTMANAADYWGIYFDMQEKVKLTFDKEGISIPFPQRDVHLFQEK